MREKNGQNGGGKELAGFIGLGLINSYGEVNINLASELGNSRTILIAADCRDLFPYWISLARVPPFSSCKEVTNRGKTDGNSAGRPSFMLSSG